VDGSNLVDGDDVNVYPAGDDDSDADLDVDTDDEDDDGLTHLFNAFRLLRKKDPAKANKILAMLRQEIDDEDDDEDTEEETLQRGEGGPGGVGQGGKRGETEESRTANFSRALGIPITEARGREAELFAKRLLS
jgi:hypothetical protein